MKTTIIMLLIIIVIGITSCYTPYPNLKPMAYDDLSYPYQVNKIELSNHVQLAYVDEGKGEQTIIFIHGLGSYLPAWQKNITDLKGQYRCIAVDLPGYGKSSKGPYPITLEFYADVIAEFSAKLDLKQVTLAGHSMGGQISMIAALKYPDLVKSLILVSPAGFEKFSAGETKWFKDVMTVDGVKNTPVQQIRANLVDNFYNMPKDAEFMVTDRIATRDAKDFEKYCYVVVQCVSGMLDQPVHYLLHKITQPTLIIFGENDNLIPNRFLHPGRTTDIAHFGNSQIAGSQLVLLPHCGHFAQFEKSQEVNQAIRGFLN